MHTLKISNYRCFYQEQTARLAPLTILVGENSTGKSSLLEVFRLIWSTATMTGNISYNSAEFPPGAFDDIISRSAKISQNNPKYTASIDYSSSVDSETNDEYSFKATFKNYKQRSRISNITIANISKNVSLHLDAIEGEAIRISIKTSLRDLLEIAIVENSSDIDLLAKDLFFLLHIARRQLKDEQNLGRIPTDVSKSDIIKKVLDAEERSFFISLIDAHMQEFNQSIQIKPMGPIRTKPKRFYERASTNESPEGEHIPEVLADLSRVEDGWSEMKSRLNMFGKKSGLFEELNVDFFGNSENSPFSILFRLSDQDGKTNLQNWHNMINLGFGVGQVLPIVTELNVSAPDKIVLMQQPEVHLHPRAQAEFGSVLCEIAGPGRMLFVETHSDYLLDRVRINVRKGVGNVRAEDVSILFLKRSGEVANIYSMKLDDYGNIVDAPDEYMDFFIEEGNELLGLP